MADVFATDGDWKQVKIGAGGWVTGIDVHKDGTMVARTDTAGAYLWDGAKWVQLVTAYSMPADIVSANGVYEIRIAPSDSNIFYMETNGGVFRSTDQGAHWTKTAFPTVFMDANSNNRMDGQKMAIDPNDANTVFAGTQKDGLWVTHDGGASWQKVMAVPQGTNGNDAPLTGIVIHNDTIYVGTAGSGIYRSEDAGQSWQRVPGGPVDASHAAISPTGELYVAGNTDTALWKYAEGTWTKLLNDSVHGIAIDPFNPSHVVIVNDGGSIQQSHDAGASWSERNWNTSLESSNDVPWLEGSGNYMSSGDIVFDPITPNKLYQSAGVGVWTTAVPSQLSWNTPVVWNSQSAGIENLVPNDIIAPLGGSPVFASWDRPFFEMDDVESYGTSYGGGGFSMGWSVDYASSDPSFLVGISDYWGTEESGFSNDGGHTWHKFTGLPSFAHNTIGGSIAASSPTNFIWAASGGVAPAYTLDGGATWTNVTVPGITDWSGLHSNYYLKRTTITADRVEPNTFYLYDALTGVHVSHDGGANWAKVFDGLISPWSFWSSKIEAVPGRAGELFFTTGVLQGSADISFMHSTDGGRSWQAVAGVEEVTTFGYGAPKVAGGPATVFIAGFVNNEYGIYYSTDDAQTWTQIGKYPMGNLDTITAISGDMNNFGMVYVGLGGSGYTYLDFDAATAPSGPVPAPVPPPVPPPPPPPPLPPPPEPTPLPDPTPPPPPVPEPTPEPAPEPLPVEDIPIGQWLFGNAKSNVLVGAGDGDQIFGKGGNDTITGGGTLDHDVLSGGAGKDTFLDTKAGLNGDTITDFTVGDKIIFSDAALAGFTFDLTGNVLTYAGGSLTLTGVSGTLIASAAVNGGVQLTIGGSGTAVPEPPPVVDVPNGVVLNGNNGANILVGVGSHDQIFGKAGNDTITGGGVLDYDTLSGGSGRDTFLDTRAGLNGDTITDFSTGDKIILSDATLAGFTFSLSGNVLTYSGGAVTLTGVSGTLVASAAASGGVQLALGSTSMSSMINYFRSGSDGDFHTSMISRLLANDVTSTVQQTDIAPVTSDASQVTHAAQGTNLAGGVLGSDDMLWRGGSVQSAASHGGFAIDGNDVLYQGAAANWNVGGSGRDHEEFATRSDMVGPTNWMSQADHSFVSNGLLGESFVPGNWHGQTADLWV